nr:hypothetical protein GCM10017745_75060 [Saccharothrix mutabilis subsp. capreolus]
MYWRFCIDTVNVAAVAVGADNPTAARESSSAEPSAVARDQRRRLPPEENMRGTCGERIVSPSETYFVTSENPHA